MTGPSMIPPTLWCGVDHPHSPHRWAQQSSGMWADCPGSTGHALDVLLCAHGCVICAQFERDELTAQTEPEETT